MKSFAIAALLSAPVLVFASSPDSSFYSDAAEAGISEVDAGKLAQQKGSSQDVKDFGAMMVKDHSKANEKLQSIASAQGEKLPTSASVMQITEAKKLQMQSGKSFDESYIKSQVKAHEDTIKLLNDEVANGKDAQAKSFASSTLPTVEGHLSKIKAIAQKDGVSID
jgi:putative membrane protein